MKNKKATYILLPAVLGIWGLVIYKVFAVSNSDTPIPPYPDTSNTKAEAINRADTFSLLASYPDPFLEAVKEVKHSSKPLAAKKEPVKPVAAVKTAWPAVTYSGMVRNQKSDKQLVMVSVNGSSNVMKVGDVVEGLALVRIFRDSIELQMGKERRFVKK